MIASTYSKENVANGGNSDLTAATLASHNVVGHSNTHNGVARSLSSSSVTFVTKEDIRDVGQLLGDAHITESEQNLRALEISRFTSSSAPSSSSSQQFLSFNSSAHDAAMDAFAKRERPESSRELARGEEKALQRTRSQQDRSSGGDSPSRGSLSDSQDGDDGADGDGSPDGNPDDPDAPTTKRWTKSQDAALRESVRIHGEKNWKAIAELVPGRNHAQCLQRWRKVLKPGLVKGHWSFEEDQVLEFLVTQGCNNWGQIAERIPGRTPKQCRERWKNHLDPAINKGPYTEDEDAVILAAQERLGNKWSQIAQLLQGRTEDSVKIRWKSLKQNPSKAAASHAQQKKNQQQSQSHASPLGNGASSYSQNAALMRQRQLHLLHHQQQLQQNEAAQQLEAQQQLQQQQLQLRLQEKMLLQQQQMHRQSLPQHQALPEDLLNVKDESYNPNPTHHHQQQLHQHHQHHQQTRMVPQMTMEQLYAAYPPQSFVAQHAAATGNGGNASQYLDDYSYRYGQSQGPTTHLGDQSDDDSGRELPHNSHNGVTTDAWDLQQDLTDSLGLSSRLGEHPPPSSFWETYPKQPHATASLGSVEPLPLALHVSDVDDALDFSF